MCRNSFIAISAAAQWSAHIWSWGHQYSIRTSLHDGCRKSKQSHSKEEWKASHHRVRGKLCEWKRERGGQTLAPFLPLHSWLIVWSLLFESYRSSGTKPSLIRRRKDVGGFGFPKLFDHLTGSTNGVNWPLHSDSGRRDDWDTVRLIATLRSKSMISCLVIWRNASFDEN